MFENYYAQSVYGQQQREALLKSVERDRLVQIARGGRRERRVRLNLSIGPLLALVRAGVKVLKPAEVAPDQCCAAAACC